MTCIVQKFGGTSVANIDRIKNAANIVAKARSENKKVAVVVSAMAGVTNKFVKYVSELGASEVDPEYDSVVSSGELVTAGLMAIALKNIGIDSRSYASWQLPILTDDNHGRATIQSVNSATIHHDITLGLVPVVCGFQGISQKNRQTTLGRGGSDLTAVAVASALNAQMCEIYSDVDGVYTVDPNLYPNARKIDAISYNEMLEMASHGAKVLQEQSVDYAMQKNVIIRVASSFHDTGGTIISHPSQSQLTKHQSFCAMAVIHNLSQIMVIYNDENSFVEVLGALKRNFIHAEIFKNGSPQVTRMMLDKRKTALAIDIIERCSGVISVRQEIVRKHLSKISIIGSNISNEISKQLIIKLRSHKIDAFDCESSQHRANLIIQSGQLLDAITVLHEYCGL